MDVVDSSNLQRQILHNLDRVGMRKVDSAKMTLDRDEPRPQGRDLRHAPGRATTSSTSSTATTSSSTVPTTSRRATSSTTPRCSKNIPVVHGSIFRFEGQVTVFNPYVGPCYRCMIPEPPPAELAPSCAEAGVLGVLPGIVGSIQAIETIKLILLSWAIRWSVDS